MRTCTAPLDQFRLGAYRPQRWDAVADLLDDGYVHRLPPAEREWMARYLREHYGANAQMLRTGLHADVPRGVGGPPRLRRWWRGVERLWPSMDGARRAREVACAKRWGLKVRVDASRRKAVYEEQNAATRDVYSLGRVVRIEELGGME